MGFLAYITESLMNLKTSKLRSFLAILGILVGTGSVVALLSSGQMATEHALQQFKTLGTNLLALSIQDNNTNASQDRSQKKYFELSNVPVIKGASSKIELVAPYINIFSSIYYDGKRLQGQVFGATDSLYHIVKLQIAKGRFVSYLDANSNFCDIGSKLASQLKLRGVMNPIGKQIQLGKRLYTIVGVTKPWQTNLFLFANLNNSVLVPLTQSYRLSPYAQISDILFRVDKGSNLKQIQTAITGKLKILLPKKRFMFRSPKQIIDIMSKQRKTFTWLLGMIGGISLLVGGIGVMNIMLVSVIERRREIGIRMAIGARRTDIRWMFLIESVTLTLFGGFLGVTLGILVSVILAEVADWGFVFFVLPPALGFAVSVLVGILSGFYPAYRASQLDPIETLQGGE
ncbi:MAG: ABC transporter permease [Coxiellaceae bacterium]|nr:ABC transporter permease [Coxiellaceae bacterium]